MSKNKVTFDGNVRTFSNTKDLKLDDMEKFRKKNTGTKYNSSLLYSKNPDYIELINEDGTSNFHTSYDQFDSRNEWLSNIANESENNYKHTVLDRENEEKLKKIKERKATLTSYDSKKDEETFCDKLGRCIIITGALYTAGKALNIIGGKTYKKKINIARYEWVKFFVKD